MFSMTNLMDHLLDLHQHRHQQQQQQQRQMYNNVPCFMDFGAHQSPNCSSSRRGSAPCGNSSRQTRNCSKIPADFGLGPFANMIQHLLQDRYNALNERENTSGSEKKTNSQRECKSDAPRKCENNQQSKFQKEANAPQPTLQDIMNHAIAAFGGLYEDEQASEIWQEKVDCRGFESREIKVKIDRQELLLKAFRKQESENGVHTSSMKKRVPLPGNIDVKRIKCKLASNGFMIIEAPYMENGNCMKENRLELVNDIVAAMLPGIEQMLRPRLGESCAESQNKGCTSDKCEEKRKQAKKTNEKEKPATKTDESEQRSAATNTEQSLLNAEEDDANEKAKTRRAHENDKTVESQTESTSESHTELAEDEELRETEDHQREVDNKHDLLRHDDADSNASDNSFVLLSQLEEEQQYDGNDGDVECEIRISPGQDIKPDSREDPEEKVETRIIQTENGKAIQGSNIKTPTAQLKENEITQQYVDEDSVNDNGRTNRDDNGDDNDTTTDNSNSNNNNNNNKDDNDNDTIITNSNNTNNYTSATTNPSNNNKVLFRLEMPSYNPESMQVTFDNFQRLLSISAASKDRSPASAPITKTVSVGDDVDETGLQCLFIDGMLTVTAPLKPTVTAIPIKVKV